VENIINVCSHILNIFGGVEGEKEEEEEEEEESDVVRDLLSRHTA
jgi:hypothetical protein